MSRLYKIVNEEKYKAALELHNKIEQYHKENLKTVQELTPFKWDKYFGSNGFSLVTRYIGFIPKEKLDQVPEGWRYDSKNEEVLIPNKKIKEGKRIAKVLEDLHYIVYREIYKQLAINDDEAGSRFTIPQLLKSPTENKEIYLNIDDKINLNEQDFEEVTLTYVRRMMNWK